MSLHLKITKYAIVVPVRESYHIAALDLCLYLFVRNSFRLHLSNLVTPADCEVVVMAQLLIGTTQFRVTYSSVACANHGNVSFQHGHLYYGLSTYTSR